MEMNLLMLIRLKGKSKVEQNRPTSKCKEEDD